MSLLARVVAQLQDKGTPHALIGAAALGLHGVTRATDDIDLFTTDLAPLDAGFWSAESKELSIDLRRGRADDPLAGVVRISDGVSALDLVVGKHRWQVSVTADAVVMQVDDARVPVATTRDLVLLKLFAGGPQDAWDIESLLAIQRDGSLQSSVAAGVERLPREARRLWDDIRGRHGSTR